MKIKNAALFLTSVTIVATTFLVDLNFGLGLLTVIVLTLFLFLMSYLEEGKKMFLSLGFQKKNATAKNLLIYAPFTAFIILLFYRYLLVPLVTKFTGVPIDISSFDVIRGNSTVLISTLLYIWTSAAFGEEIIFRGYLMTRFSKLFGNSTISLLFNILIFSTFFGFIHSYQGITGQVLNTIVGAIIALIFHFRKNDLWFAIIVHGMIDTLAIIAIYLNIF